MDRVGGMVQAVMQVIRSDGGRQVKLHSPAAHLLLLQAVDGHPYAAPTGVGSP